MKRFETLWRPLLRLWLPPALFFVLNLAGYLAYELVISSSAAAREARFDRATSNLEELVEERRELDEFVASAVENNDGIREFYGRRLGAENERLTYVIAEIKKLARTAGLEPSSIRYTLERIAQQDLVERSLQFTVEGKYLELRRLINMLELSDSFIILNQVGLSENDDTGSVLRINLQLTTLFQPATLVATEEETT